MQAELQLAINMMVECLENGGKLLCCGNGGSAAEAGHLATEFLCRYEQDRPSLSAVNLAADGSFLTATANDYRFDQVFARQVDGLGRKGDVLVTFSTSGNSPSIIEALRATAARGMRSISFLGKEGGDAKAISDIALVVPSPTTSHIQEAHQVMLHYICRSVERRLFPALDR